MRVGAGMFTVSVLYVYVFGLGVEGWGGSQFSQLNKNRNRKSPAIQ